MWIFWKNVKSLSLSPKQPKKKKEKKKKNQSLVFCSPKVPGGFQPRQPSLERILYFPNGFLAGRWEINTLRLSPSTLRISLKYEFFYHWNRLHYWIYPLYNIIRPFISNIPFPMLLREDKWVATDLSSLYFSWGYSNIWKCQASLRGWICQMLRTGVAHGCI